MKNTESLGAAMALAVTQLLGCGANQPAQSAASVNTPSPDAVASAAGDASGSAELIHCYGVNQCKGHNDCKTAENDCAGHAECKGHGFVGTTKKSCVDVGGELKDDFKGEVASADLIHCFGVNQCKGHNDCKTAENGCAGHSVCKGHGFVATPAKACGDIGGTIQN